MLAVRVHIRPRFAMIMCLIDGNINGIGKGSGDHYIKSDNVRVVNVIDPPDANGVIRANTQIRDSKTGGWVDKPAATTFFPDAWSRRQTVKEIYDDDEKALLTKEQFIKSLEHYEIFLDGDYKNGVTPDLFEVEYIAEGEAALSQFEKLGGVLQS